jgi:hypothetical protein
MARLSRSPTFFHVLPPSERLVDAIAVRNVAANASFARAHINVVMELATARLPIDPLPSLSKTDDHVIAPSVDFHTRRPSRRNNKS